MTVFDATLDFAPVSVQGTDPILPEDRFVFELVGFERSEPDQYRKDGGIRWTWRVFQADGVTPFVFKDEQYLFYRTTGINKDGKPVMNVGTSAYDWACAMLGREIPVDGRLNVAELRNARMSAMVVWEKQRSDPTKKSIKLASMRHIAKVGGPLVAASSAATAQTVNVDALRTMLKNKIRKSEVLQTAQHLTWISLNVDAMDADDLNSYIRDVQADIDAD